MHSGETEDETELDTPVQEEPPKSDRSHSTSTGQQKLSMRELSLRYLQRPAIIFSNIDLFRRV
jgi:hypothetical protein